MSTTPTNDVCEVAAPPPPAARSPGIARNVAANWAGHFVAVLAGFVIPRIINDHLGQVQLGLWDLGWSLVNSLPLLMCGMEAAPNRFVARHRAAGDWEGLKDTTSACMAVFLASAAVALTITLILTQFVNVLLPHDYADYIPQARWVVLLLGAALVVQMPIGLYNGAITGSQRYDIINIIETSGRVAGVGAMFAVLVNGGGLIALCTVTLSREVVVGVLKYWAAHRLLPELTVSARRVRWDTVKTVVVFGGKYYLAAIGNIVLYQGNRLLLISFLGPAALALFSRPLGLVLAMHQLVIQFARVMTPVASEMQVRGSTADLAGLLVRTTRYAVLIAVPPVLVLVIFGRPILRLWMGDEFAVGHVLAVLALGHLAGTLQIGPYHVLVGMSRHGKVAFAMLIGSVASVIVTAVLLGVFHMGLIGAALGVAIPMTIVNALVIPAYLLRAVELPVGRYLGALGRGLIPVLPCAAVLIVARIFVSDETLWPALASAGLGMVVLAVTCWLTMPGLQRWRRVGFAGTPSA